MDYGYTTKEILQILRESERSISLSRLCSKYGITPSAIYLWQQKYGNSGAAVLENGGPLKFSAVMSLFALTLAVVSCYHLFLTGYGYIESGQSKQYATTMGKIIAAAGHNISQLDLATGYDSPSLLYEYEIDGERFLSNKVCIGKTQPEHLRQYAVGSDVQVFYNASDPRKSCLEKGIHPSLYMFVIQSMVWAMLAVTIFFSGQLIRD